MTSEIGPGDEDLNHNDRSLFREASASQKYATSQAVVRL
jgi:hypothetical protein